ncbi:hypothetical protein VOLCADRAFT_100570 [Volvox carteri f. nagariensis]|uniref:WRKY domain-containing protein n=1 Tax=Volvox carteri f. nagariensis TaxID=3068 RepID=D8UKI5_VOLCA|nr:uncharacterized protein VOLCADRAFT_100570 [Volvox carteri f. nagariensis]EFJ39758.1 hypothetical protein VOLCADRAFT_100570 [Volvox carteri f. nagariensis]|eukprot:XP_002959168.1 hypothetical protein VOLCADRAFT_100570 [Volvox carteri f. nagariensis]
MILTPRVGGSCCSTEQLPWAVAEMAAADARLLLMVREAKGDEGGEEVEAVNGQQEEVIGPLSEIAAILLAEGISPVVLQQMLPPGQPGSPPPPPLPPPLSPRQLQEGVSFPTVPQVPEEARQWQPPLPLLPYAAAADGAVQPAAAIPAYDGQWVALPGCAPPPPRRPGGSAGSGRAAAKRGPSSATAGSMYDNDWAPASSGRCTASAVATDVTHRRPSSKRRRKNDGTFKPSKPALANVQHIPAVQPASSSPTLVQPLPSACSLHRAVQPPPPPASRARFSVLGRDLPNEYRWRKYGEKWIDGMCRSYFRLATERLKKTFRACGADHPFFVSKDPGDREPNESYPGLGWVAAGAVAGVAVSLSGIHRSHSFEPAAGLVTPCSILRVVPGSRTWVLGLTGRGRRALVQRQQRQQQGAEAFPRRIAASSYPPIIIWTWLRNSQEWQMVVMVVVVVVVK